MAYKKNKKNIWTDGQKKGRTNGRTDGQSDFIMPQNLFGGIQITQAILIEISSVQLI